MKCDRVGAAGQRTNDRVGKPVDVARASRRARCRLGVHRELRADRQHVVKGQVDWLSSAEGERNNVFRIVRFVDANRLREDLQVEHSEQR